MATGQKKKKKKKKKREGNSEFKPVVDLEKDGLHQPIHAQHTIVLMTKPVYKTNVKNNIHFNDRLR